MPSPRSFPGQTPTVDVLDRGLGICMCLAGGMSGKEIMHSADLTHGEFYHALRILKAKHKANTLEHLIFILTKEGALSPETRMRLEER